ncbi:MAG: 50S ribosomal protein L29 [Candidatus Rokuibacteriota bacterium]
MKPEKWREKSDDELREEMRGLSDEIYKLRFQLAMGVAKNPSRVGQVRRDVARIQTILRERAQPTTRKG